MLDFETTPPVLNAGDYRQTKDSKNYTQMSEISPNMFPTKNEIVSSSWRLIHGRESGVKFAGVGTKPVGRQTPGVLSYLRQLWGFCYYDF